MTAHPTNPFDNAKPVTPKNLPGNLTEADLNKQQAEADQLRSAANLNNAKAKDQEKLTELKESFAGAVMFFLWFWFLALIFAISFYFSISVTMGKEIPKEVIIAMFTCTAVVVGLVGYILKGLFGSST